ncbi:MAG: phosphopantothenoylcysteine decarboxylase [Phycisphaerae bacterium]|nr:phosphopantothenoylcysteine decarboxylase [Phycisphaerae bacterium]
MTPNGLNSSSPDGLFQGRHVGIGVTGGIAAYKVCQVVSQLTQGGALVDVLMTPSAQKFVGEATFQALSGRPVLCDPWEGPDPSDPQHIRVARRLELLLIAPASMNTIGRLAHGITEDVITLTAAGIPPQTIPRILAPSMNAAMWSQASTQRNLKLLQDDGWLVVPPDEGMQACQTTGPGRLPEPESLLQTIADHLT